MSPPRLPATHTPDERNGAERTPPAHSDPALELPHERDQNLDATEAQPDPVMKQAARDLKKGQVDTDLRATPGLDAQRREQLLAQSDGEGETGPIGGEGLEAGEAGGGYGGLKPDANKPRR